MIRALVIGESPAPRGTGGWSLSTALACRAAGVAPDLTRATAVAWSRLSERQRLLLLYAMNENLLQRWPGYQGRGSGFPRESARRAAAIFAPPASADVVLLAGRRVARAFGTDDAVPYFRALSRRGRWPRWYVVPHPSGVSGHWSDPAAAAALYAFLDRIARARRPS